MLSQVVKRLSNALPRRRVARTLVVAIVFGLLQSVVGLIPAANAAGTPLVTLPTNGWVIAPNETTTISGASVSGLSETSTYLITIAINGTYTPAKLSLPVTNGITPSYGYEAGKTNSFASFTKISFTGTRNDVNTALGSLRIATGAAAASGTTPSISISAVENITGLAFNPSNNHYYKAYTYGASIPAGVTDRKQSTAMSWAATQTFAGQSGYLVTITSADENTFVSTTIQNASNIWIGANDSWTGTINSTNYIFGEGYWGWSATNSPEFGAGFSYDSSTGSVSINANGTYSGKGNKDLTGTYSSTNASITMNGAGGASSNGYANWCNNEPNNADGTNGGEHAAVTNWNTGTCWNDLANNNNSTVNGFVVEFGSNAESGGFTGAATSTAYLYIGPKFTLASTDSMTGQVGTALATTPTVTLTDSMGTAIPGATVNFSVSRGTLDSTSVTTNSSGQANPLAWRMPSSTGLDTVTARYLGATSTPLVISAYAIAAPTLETDTALSLNGTSQYATAPDNNSLDIPSAITLEAWVKPTANPASDGTWSMVINKPASYEIGMARSAGKTYWTYGLQSTSGTQYLGVRTNMEVALNEWHHIAISRAADSSTVRFYYDGNLVFTGSADVAGTSSLNNSSYPLAIGARYTSPIGFTESFTGSIDQIAIFAAERSQLNIKSDMYSYLDSTTSGLRAYYDFNELSGSVAFNRVFKSLGNNDLSIVGGAQFVDVKSVDTSGPYTVVKFPRTYINSIKGWKYSGAASKVTVLVVGGGGGGGGGYEGGGGGAGGFIETTTSVSTGSLYQISVGTGGRGALTSTPPTNGDSTTALGLYALGGGYGGYEFYSTQGPGNAGGSGGGGNWGNDKTAGTGTANQGNNGGNSSDLYTGSPCSPGPGVFAGGGGGGAGSVGTPAICTKGGNGGDGKTSIITGTTFAAGGGGSLRIYNTTGNIASTYQGFGGSRVNGVSLGGDSSYYDSVTVGSTGGATNGTNNTGSGGGASWHSLGTAGNAGFGGAGYVAIRWITATKPTYTKPSNITIDLGQTETFTVNVASDSATALLTRTFKWESTTAGTGGTFTKIKEGTGAANAVFSWVPSDTSTTGSSYLYRLTVTDSDTAGLFITESSTAYATINPAMVASGSRSLVKTVNKGKSETYTITLGTGPYKISWLGTEPNLRFETTTATVLLKVSDTASVGTYYETITVVDSVSAVLLVPVIIKVVSPPTLLFDGPLTSTGLVLDYQIGHSQSLLGTDGQATTGLTLRDLSGRQNDASTGGTFANTLCNAPTFSKANGGAIGFGNQKCYASSYNGDDLRNHYTAEVWFKKTGSFGMNSFLLSQPVNTSAHSAILVGSMGETDQSLRVGFYADGLYRTTSCGYIPNLNEWTHIAGTYDGQTLKTYINGNLLCSTPSTASIPDSSVNNDPIIIGVGPAGGGIYINAQIASVRLYKTPLSDSEIAENYRLSKTRFISTSNFLSSISKKYGASSQETYTVVSGTETNTISFSVGSKTGITWDSATSTSLIKLKLQESATVGTNYETLTVTDFNGSTTILPLTIEVSKADTLTVTMESATTTSYNGLKLTVYPKPTIRGLVSSDTATSVTRFSSTIYSETTTVPTNADTYTVRGSDPVFTSGSFDNYLGIVFDTSTAVINKINQRPLNVFMYGGVVGSPFLILLQGGDGEGAVTETLTGVSNIPECAISNHTLTSTTTTQGFCEVRVVKAGSQNYFAETQTVQMYFIAYVASQPNPAPGTGPNISLPGRTDYSVVTTAPPTITGLSTTTISRASTDTFTVTGTGFNAGDLVVIFFHDVTVTPTGVTATKIDLRIADIVNNGAITGRVTVSTANGSFTSRETLTITP